MAEPDEDEIANTVAAMTDEDLVAVLSGEDNWYTRGREAAGVPSLKLTDGPTGARGDWTEEVPSAAFPAGVALGATWDEALAREVGEALGDEARQKKADVLLGPTINLQRSPLSGRGFECLSEDPLPTARLGVAIVRGVQSRGVAACPKHLACNDQEHERHEVSVEADEAVLRSVYLLPFERAVREGGAWCVMAAYNKLQGTYACEHEWLLRDVLKGAWGFDGVVVSDWFAARDGAASLRAGLDLEMPGPPRVFGEALLAALRDGAVEREALEDAARRLLRLAARVGRTPGAARGREEGRDDPGVRALLRRAAAAGTVLVKNDGALPLPALGAGQTLAVIGPNAAEPAYMGGGSSEVRSHEPSAPLDALRSRYPEADVVHEAGCSAARYAPLMDAGTVRDGFRLERWADEAFGGEPVETRRWPVSTLSLFDLTRAIETDGAALSLRLTGRFVPDRDGPHAFGLTSCGPSRLLVGGAVVVDLWAEREPGESFFGHGCAEARGTVHLKAGEAVRVVIEYARTAADELAGVRAGVLPPTDEAASIAAAADLARRADRTVLILGTNAEWEAEGRDRATLALPGRQDDLARAVLAADPRAVVVLNVGGPILMPWLDEAGAVVVPWYPGQAFGVALADVLSGDADPGGRMPQVWPRRVEDHPATPHGPPEGLTIRYEEGHAFGHRGMAAEGTEPLVPFGHGLSYGEATVRMREVVRDEEGLPRHALAEAVTSGDRAATVVVRAYLTVTTPSGALDILVGWAKASLAPGRTATLSVPIDLGTVPPGADPSTARLRLRW